MSKQSKAEAEVSVARSVLVCSGLLSLMLAIGGWYLDGWSFARSVLLGGGLVSASFWLLKSDIQRLMRRVVVADGQGSAVSSEKIGFFLRFYARLVVLGLLLFVLASRMTIDVIGLTLGLATVMISVVIIGLSTGRCWMPSKV